MASIALTITVKNERDLLRANILYHRYLGITIFYVFLDDTTDGTQDTVSDLDYVVFSPSTYADRFLESEEHRHACAASAGLRAAIEKSAENHEARQVLNAYVALEQARDAGIDWLISLDADELVWPDSSPILEGELSWKLDSIGEHIEQVRFPPLEVMQKRCRYNNVFSEAVLFKRHGLKVWRDLFDPLARRTRKFEFVRTRFHRMGIYQVRRFSWWYGHQRGKWAVRIGPSILPFLHGCLKLDGSPLITEDKFHLLHYIMYNQDDFIKKHRSFVNRPDTHVRGSALAYRHRLWRDIVNNPSFSDGALDDYYRQWIAFGEDEIECLRERNDKNGIPYIVEITAVKEAFEKLAVWHSEGSV